MQESGKKSFRLHVLWHSLFWLCVGNGTGVLLALLLVFPFSDTGEGMIPFGYGRWMTVHLNTQLYGWCAMPLIGLLAGWFQADPKGGRWMRASLGLWSLSLASGVVSWLSGASSGKLFLEWTGIAKHLFLFNLVFLLAAFVWEMRAIFVKTIRSLQVVAWHRIILVSFLALVPVVMHHALDTQVYPPINPLSGGPTGSSLVGSTVVILLIFILFPAFLGLPCRKPFLQKWVWVLFLLQTVLFLFLGHDNQPNTSPLQILGMGSLSIWGPVLWIHYRNYFWSAESGAWLRSFGFWGLCLLLPSLVVFLPGYLKAFKFTHVLVSHSHVAMAGMITSFNMVLLVLFCGREGAFLFRRDLFRIWHLGALVFVAALFAIGLLEAAHPGILFHRNSIVTLLYSVRLLAGTLMFWVSLVWFSEATRLLLLSEPKGFCVLPWTGIKGVYKKLPMAS